MRAGDLHNLITCAESALRSSVSRNLSAVQMSDAWASVEKARAELVAIRTEDIGALEPITAAQRHKKP